MMRFCLFDFFEENTVEIGLSSYIDETDIHVETLNNEEWDFSKEVLVNWPTGRNQTTQYVARLVYFAESRLDENLLKERDRLIGRIKPSAGVPGKRRIVKPKKLTDDVIEIPVSSALPAKVRKTESKPGQHLMQQLIKQRSEKTQAPVNESINDMHRRMKELQDENKQLRDELQNCRRQMNAQRSLESLLSEIPGLLNDVKSLRESQPQTEAEHSRKGLQSWSKSPQRMLQDLMSQSFTREEMAAHSLTGKKSNANGSLPPRPRLDP